VRDLRPRSNPKVYLIMHYLPGEVLLVDWADFGFTNAATRANAVFPWRAERVPRLPAPIGDIHIRGAREHAFGEDRGAQARLGPTIGDSAPRAERPRVGASKHPVRFAHLPEAERLDGRAEPFRSRIRAGKRRLLLHSGSSPGERPRRVRRSSMLHRAWSCMSFRACSPTHQHSAPVLVDGWGTHRAEADDHGRVPAQPRSASLDQTLINHEQKTTLRRCAPGRTK
jgi:hypothetical protein